MHLQKQKVYVQDRLRENGELVWKLLQGGGHFYVCGDAAHMAGSVEQALLHIIDQHQVQQALGCGSGAYHCTFGSLHEGNFAVCRVKEGRQVQLTIWRG